MQQDNPLQQQRLENSFGERCLMDNKHQQCALETVNTHCVLGHITKSIENGRQKLSFSSTLYCVFLQSHKCCFGLPPVRERVSNWGKLSRRPLKELRSQSTQQTRRVWGRWVCSAHLQLSGRGLQKETGSDYFRGAQWKDEEKFFPGRVLQHWNRGCRNILGNTQNLPRQCPENLVQLWALLCFLSTRFWT